MSGEKIPLVHQPVLRRPYTADISNRHMAATLISQLMDGLKKIQSCLPGKFKVWCSVEKAINWLNQLEITGF